MVCGPAPVAVCPLPKSHVSVVGEPVAVLVNVTASPSQIFWVLVVKLATGAAAAAAMVNVCV
jgi:hypothetical protein